MQRVRLQSPFFTVLQLAQRRSAPALDISLRVSAVDKKKIKSWPNTVVVKSVRLGYFEDFKSSDTLLMEAGAEGLQRLATVFRSLASGKVRALALHELPFIETYHSVQLIASCSSQVYGTRRGDAANTFLWERSNLGWEYSAEKLGRGTRKISHICFVLRRIQSHADIALFHSHIHWQQS